MMKKLLYVFLAVFTLTSCQEEELLPVPNISDISASGVTFVDGKARMTVGQSATLVVECTNVNISHYAWLVNDRVESGEKEFVFTPVERGMYHIKVRIYNDNNGVDERSVGAVLAVDPAPVITCVHGDEQVLSTTTANDFAVADGEAMTLAVVSDNVPVIGYEWKMNGTVVEGVSAATYSFDLSWSGEYDFEVTAVNRDSVTATAAFTVNLTGQYKNGILFYGTTNEDLAFFNDQTTTFYSGNLFEKTNGSRLSVADMSGGLNDMFIYDNKIYLLTPSSSDGSDRARIAVCDAQTFKLQKSIYATGFDMASMGYIYNLMVVNENKFYIGYNPMSNSGGIRVLTVNTDGTTHLSGDIVGTAGALGVNGPATFARMLKHGKYVIAGCGSKVQVIDGETDAVVKTIEIDATRQVADVVKGRDGKIYAFIAGTCDKSDPYWLWSPEYTGNASVITIDPAGFAVTNETKLMDGNTHLFIKAAMEANGAVASLTSDEIFFTVGAVYTPCKVYRYNYATGVVSLFASPGGVFGKYMATDKNGYLYAATLTSDYQSFNTNVYRIDDGAKMTAIESLITTMNGDGGFSSTYRFE